MPPKEHLIVSASKPSGVATHSPDSGKTLGFVEWLSEQTQQKLLVTHRLDKLTSGVILFAKNKIAAEFVRKSFEAGEVEKSYLFISRHKPQQNKWQIKSHIEKGQKGRWVSHNNLEPNSETHFQLESSHQPFYLIRAKPITGKTHQIRLHARASQTPVLGDPLYCSDTFFRMLLHCESMTVQGQTYKSSAPDFFYELKKLQNTELCISSENFKRREYLFDEYTNSEQCLRLLDDNRYPLRIDKFGEGAVMGWWSDKAPSNEDWEQINLITSDLPIKHHCFHFRGKHERETLNSKITHSPPSPQSWVAKEGHIKYLIRSELGLYVGLFLDQRYQRKWVTKNTHQKRVLNLFAYTGGFSLCAASAGATEVTTVDLSKNYIEWSKENFKLNEFDTSAHKFYSMDSLAFLKWAKKKGLQYDFIVCDPPSFSRSKKGNWHIEKQLKPLLKAIYDVSSENSQLLFSNNFEKWNAKKWPQILQNEIKDCGWLEKKSFATSWDFEWQGLHPKMKSVLLTRI